MAQTRCKILVDGITQSGHKFRPSDWAERLSESVSQVGPDHRIRYSPYVEPVLIEGHAALKIDPYLKEVNPRAFKQLIDFIKDNKLTVLESCQVPDLQSAPLAEAKAASN
ncbi:MAG: DUF3579 domain-containing protein [Pseudomonadota bacterium]